MFISHDRYFMDALAQQVFELNSGNLRIFPGNYSDFLARVDAEQTVIPPLESKVTNFTYKTKEQKKEEAIKRQQLAKWKKEVLQPLQNIEEDIADAEEKLRTLEGLLADNNTYSDRQKAEKYLGDYQDLQKHLKALYEKWEQLQKTAAEGGPADLL